MDILLNTPSGFDMDEVAGLAAHRDFDGVQLYLNSAVAEDGERLEAWCKGLEQRGLMLAVHMPPDPEPLVLEALQRIARPGMPVISHYPAAPFVPHVGAAAWEFSPFGILPEDYSAWLRHCREAGALPVVDPPRLFKETDEEEACRFARQLFSDLAGVRYMLHLIDCDTVEQLQGNWCEMGQGRVGRFLERTVIPLPELLVLEFGSLIQSVNSLPWVRRMARQMGA